MAAPKTFFTSDNHFYHKNIIQYSNRPFRDVAEMNEAMIENHNSVVSPEDTVWFLGDFGFEKIDKLQAIIRRLKGHKHIIWGNHDKTLQQNQDLIVGKPGMFESAQFYKEISVEGQHIILCHFPFETWNKSHHSSIHLHGHCHSSLPPRGKRVDVGVDSFYVTGAATYTPFTFDEIRRFMSKQTFEVVDHHGR